MGELRSAFVHRNAKNMDRGRQVLGSMLAHIGGDQRHLTLYLLVDLGRDQDLPRRGHHLQPSSNVGSVAIEVVSLDNDVAKVNAATPEFAAVICFCKSTAHAMALTAPANSMSTPSPISFTIRPS